MAGGERSSGDSDQIMVAVAGIYRLVFTYVWMTYLGFYAVWELKCQNKPEVYSSDSISICLLHSQLKRIINENLPFLITFVSLPMFSVHSDKKMLKRFKLIQKIRIPPSPEF